MANKVYNKDLTYRLVYSTVDVDGKMESYGEYDGILPTLFLSPAGENYVSIVIYDPDKVLEISVPVFDRERLERPKSGRPLSLEYIGSSHEYAILYDVDIWSDTKPDEMMSIEFDKEGIKKKHRIKIPFPRDNKIYIENHQIHLLAKDGRKFLHRQIDAKGKLIRERILRLNTVHFLQILKLSFAENSYLLCEEKGRVFIEKISANGDSTSIDLVDIGSSFYSTWLPVKVAEDVVITRFTVEDANGWISTRKDQLVEFFLSDQKGYKNLVNNEFIKMELEHLVISSLNKTTENAYALVFYPMTDRNTMNTKLLVLNRKIQIDK